jgi:hypothetical protein
MRLYALVEAGDPEAIDVFLCEQDAQRALEDCQPRDSKTTAATNTWERPASGRSRSGITRR